jgi:Zn-dependent protease with chaperone function
MRRRALGSSAVLTIGLQLPWFLPSCGLVVITGVALGDPWGALVVLTWLLSGAGVFLRPLETVLARTMFRLRRPAESEERRLTPLWSAVTAAAGVNGTTYDLWVEESREVNASAAAGHLVSVSRWALDALPPEQLKAVLAHELGHHLGGLPWVRLLGLWYSQPARVVTRIGALIGRSVIRLVHAASPARPVAWLVLCALAALCLAAVLDTAAWLLALLAVTPLQASVSRLEERRADRFAAQIGFGEPLRDVLQHWLTAGHDVAHHRAGWRARLTASHPTCAARIRALEPYLP